MECLKCKKQLKGRQKKYCSPECVWKNNKGSKNTYFKIGHIAYKANLGKKFSIETRKKISEGHIGQQAWNKGIIGVLTSPNKGKKFAYKERPSMKGKIPWNKGMSFPERSGENNHQWKGGITSTNTKLRKTTKYNEWRKHVFQRDDYTCQMCSKRGGKLNADHELPFALYPDLRFEILNGRTLCDQCHRKTDSWGNLEKYKKIHLIYE